MGEDRGIWNLDKCEVVSASRNYYELIRISRGEHDYAKWEGLGGLRLAVLLGLTPQIPSILTFYEKYWGRWNGDRIAVTGDYTKADGMVYNMCTWTDITEVVDLAIAELFLYLALVAQDRDSKKKYAGVALWILRNSLERSLITSNPLTIVKLMADTVQETGSLRLAIDEAFNESEKGLRYCKRIEQSFDTPLTFYIGADCTRVVSDYQLEWLDESRVFEMYFREDEHLAVPSDVVYAFNAFMRMVEGDTQE